MYDELQGGWKIMYLSYISLPMYTRRGCEGTGTRHFMPIKPFWVYKSKEAASRLGRYESPNHDCD